MPDHATAAEIAAAYAVPGGVPEVFSAKTADYAAARPGYPPGLYDRLAGLLPQAASIADVGAGTGLLTRGLLERGWSVVAIEPSAAMRAAADATLGGFAGYRSLAGTAEAMPLEDGSVDLVTAAQAFHWFEIEAARRECLRVLRPAGQVVLIWNDRVLEDPLQDALDALFTRFGGARREALRQREDRRRVPDFFRSPVQPHERPQEQTLDREGLVALAFSRSYMPARASEVGVQAEGALLQLHARFESGGRVLLRYRTLAFVGRPA